jgi:hypothetical protein
VQKCKLAFKSYHFSGTPRAVVVTEKLPILRQVVNVKIMTFCILKRIH